ncbi:hypothetical protein [Mycobacterium sp. URHB0044]|uniref:hypothetical protein n=1 Tax=Mycobacterium sp. URHB0044 TaxID=1380386 RepID=UPI00048FA24B|nr:hypothetical protein [Mycobacterium sp. URHB0044]
MQPGYGDGSPYGQGQPEPARQADYGGPLPDYLQPGFAPHGPDGDASRKSKLPWIIGAVAMVLIVAVLAAVLAV